MEKEAWVVEVKGDEVRLRYMRHSACSNCGACLVFGQGPGEEEVVLPNNTFELKKGDRVAVGLNSTSLLRASLLVYMVPLLFFLLGYLGGARLGVILKGTAWVEAGGVIGGAVALIFAYLGLNFYDRNLRKSPRYQPQVTRVLERGLEQ